MLISEHLKKKKISINDPIQYVCLSTRNYEALKKKARKNRRDTKVIRTRLRYDQMLDKQYKISMSNILRP